MYKIIKHSFVSAVFVLLGAVFLGLGNSYNASAITFDDFIDGNFIQKADPNDSNAPRFIPEENPLWITDEMIENETVDYYFYHDFYVDVENVPDGTLLMFCVAYYPTMNGGCDSAAVGGVLEDGTVLNRVQNGRVHFRLEYYNSSRGLRFIKIYGAGNFMYYPLVLGTAEPTMEYYYEAQPYSCTSALDFDYEELGVFQKPVGATASDTEECKFLYWERYDEGGNLAIDDNRQMVPILRDDVWTDGRQLDNSYHQYFYAVYERTGGSSDSSSGLTINLSVNNPDYGYLSEYTYEYDYGERYVDVVYDDRLRMTYDSSSSYGTDIYFYPKEIKYNDDATAIVYYYDGVESDCELGTMWSGVCNVTVNFAKRIETDLHKVTFNYVNPEWGDHDLTELYVVDGGAFDAYRSYDDDNNQVVNIYRGESMYLHPLNKEAPMDDGSFYYYVVDVNNTCDYRMHSDCEVTITYNKNLARPLVPMKIVIEDPYKSYESRTEDILAIDGSDLVFIDYNAHEIEPNGQDLVWYIHYVYDIKGYTSSIGVTPNSLTNRNRDQYVQTVESSCGNIVAANCVVKLTWSFKEGLPMTSLDVHLGSYGDDYNIVRTLEFPEGTSVRYSLILDIAYRAFDEYRETRGEFTSLELMYSDGYRYDTLYSSSNYYSSDNFIPVSGMYGILRMHDRSDQENVLLMPRQGSPSNSRQSSFLTSRDGFVDISYAIQQAELFPVYGYETVGWCPVFSDSNYGRAYDLDGNVWSVSERFTSSSYYNFDVDSCSKMWDFENDSFNSKYLQLYLYQILAPSAVPVEFKVADDESYGSWEGVDGLQPKYGDSFRVTGNTVYINDEVITFIPAEPDNYDYELDKITTTCVGKNFLSLDACEFVAHVTKTLHTHELHASSFEMPADLTKSYVLVIDEPISLGDFKAAANVELKVFADGVEIADDTLLATGQTAVFYVDGAEVLSSDVIMYGDPSADGVVNSADLFTVRKHLLGSNLTGSQFKAADVNRDKTVNSADLLKMRRYLLGLDKGL